LKISYLEQLNGKIFASLPTSFTCLKIDHLIKRIGINSSFLQKQKTKNKKQKRLQMQPFLVSSDT